MGRRSHFAFRVRSGWWKPLHLNFKWRYGSYFIPTASGKPQNGVISPKIFLKPILSQEGECLKDADKPLLLSHMIFWVVYKSSFMRVKASCVWGTKNWKMLTIAVCCSVGGGYFMYWELIYPCRPMLVPIIQLSYSCHTPPQSWCWNKEPTSLPLPPIFTHRITACLIREAIP